MDDKPGKFSSQQLKAHFGRYYLHLLLVCKPHNEAVTCMDIDPKGELLASGVSRTTSITCRAVLLTVHLGHARGKIHQQQMRRGRGKGVGGNGGGGGNCSPFMPRCNFQMFVTLESVICSQKLQCLHISTDFNMSK